MKIKQSKPLKIKGTYTMNVFDATTGAFKRSSEHSNIVVAANNAGVDLITQALAGLDTYSLNLDKAAIGTGTTSPTVSDTELENPTLTGIQRADVVSRDATSISLDFLITDAELANGDYSEFALYADTQLFARSLIQPAFTKATNENTLINYVVEFSTT